MNENDRTTFDEEEAICGLVEEFSNQWTTHPSLEAVLAAADSRLRKRLLKPLLEIELSYRHRRGETSSEADLCARFPGEEGVISAAREAVEIDFAPEPRKELRFGPYVAEECVGHGGMGVVYKARLNGKGAPVALKSIRNAFDNQQSQRLVREIKVLKMLDDPHIVSVIGQGEEADKPYYVMPLFEAGSFNEIVVRKKLAPKHVAELLTPVVRALAKAHAAGVLHRDIKPSNLLFDEDHQRVVLADFGLATIGSSPGATENGDLVGTVEYMAPEQLKNAKNADERSDVYGMGATLYQLVTGQRPFGDLSGSELRMSIENDNPKPVRKWNRNIDRDLSVLIEKCLQKEPRQRYQTAAALADDLQAFLAGRPIAARPVAQFTKTMRWCRRNKAPTGLITVSLLFSFFMWGYFVEVYSQLTEQKEFRQRTQEFYRTQEELLRTQDEFEANAVRFAQQVENMDLREREFAAHTANLEMRQLETFDLLDGMIEDESSIYALLSEEKSIAIDVTDESHSIVQKLVSILLEIDGPDSPVVVAASKLQNKLDLYKDRLVRLKASTDSLWVSLKKRQTNAQELRATMETNRQALDTTPRLGTSPNEQ